MRYLKDDGIYLAWTSEETLQMMIDHTIFPPLESHSGGYHQIDARGHQILLNYRPTKSGIARQLTLDQALNGEIDPDWVKDRIVLIGNTDPSFRDFHTTPYSRNAQGSMPEVVIQAHMISQILNVVLNNQPLLQPWNVWGEIAWIVGWAIAGGTFVWVLQSSVKIGLTTGGAIALLYGGSLLLLIQGIWVPLVPGAIALLGTVGAGLWVPRSFSFWQNHR